MAGCLFIEFWDLFTREKDNIHLWGAFLLNIGFTHSYNDRM